MSTAELGFRIDSSAAKSAAVDLDALVAASQRAEKAERDVGRASREAQGGVRSLASAIKQLTEAENRAAGSQFAERRARDIAAYGQELDRLRAKFNPIFAASKAYESSLDELNRAHRVGAIGTREYESALEQLNAEFAMVQSGAMQGAAGLSSVRLSMQQSGQMSRQLMFQMVDLGQTIPLAMASPAFALQNVGFQVAQIGQLYFGQGGMQAALRDMASMTMGAVRGIGRMASSVLALAAANPVAAVAIAGVTAVVGGAIASFFSGGEAAEDYADSLEKLREATDDLRGFNDLASDLDSLTDKYGEVTAAVFDLIRAQREQALEQQRRAAAEQIATLRGFTSPLGEVDLGQVFTGGLSNFLSAFREMKSLIEAIETAEGLKAQAEAAARLRQFLEGSPDLIAAMGERGRELESAVVSAESELRQAAVTAGEVQRPIESAEDAANRLAGNLGGATRNASDLANELQRGLAALAGMAQSAQDRLAEAQIGLRFHGDPVGEARALAQREAGQDIADFQSVANQLGIPSGLRDQMLEPMKDYARETVAAAAQTARLNERVAELNKSAKSGTSEAEKLAEAYADLVSSGQQFIAEQQIEQQALGMTEEAAQRLRNEFDLFSQAQQAGIDLTPTQTAQIRDLAAAMAEAEAKTKRSTFMDDAAESASDFIAEKEMEVRALRMSEEAARRMRIEFEFLNDAAREGIELTPEQVARLRELAGQMAATEAETSALREAFDFAKETTTGFFRDMQSGIEQGKGLWRSFADAATKAIDRITDKLLNDMLDAIFKVNDASSGGSGLFGKLLGFLGLGATASFPTTLGGANVGNFGYAKGGAFSAGREITAFASGGIVDRATLFPMASGMGLMGEAGPEAVMPLRRGADGRLGVEMAGGGRRAAQIVKIGDTNIVVQGTGSPEDVARRLEPRLAKHKQEIFEEITRANERDPTWLHT